MKLWHILTGTMTVRLTCADPEKVLAGAVQRGIELRQIQQVSDLVCTVSISRRDWNAWCAVVRRGGGDTHVQHRSGLYWPLRALGRRKLLVTGWLILVLLSLWLPQRILFFQVKGNAAVSQQQILEAAREAGLAFGVSRRDLRSEAVKNSLLASLPELSWAGVNTYGCVAEISVRERDQNLPEVESGGVSHVVASRDGFVLAGTVLRGSGQFRPGQTVQAGDVLISGYTDCGLCIQGARAEGEVWAQTAWDLRAQMPAQCAMRGGKQAISRKISLLIGKKRINLWKDSGISPVTCGRMYEEYYVTLPGGFQLPLAVCVDTSIRYEMAGTSVEEAQALAILSDFVARYLPDQMVAGRVIHAVEQLDLLDGLWSLEGKYVCEEMISRQQAVKIGDTNG